MPKKVFIETHGCQMNEYDSDSIANLLHATQGMEITQDPSEADCLLINTCSIREKAEHKVYSTLGQWRELKKLNPGMQIGVGGCVASQEGIAIKRRAPYVDVIFGPQTLHRLPEMLQQAANTKKTVVDVSFPEIEKFDRLPEPKADGPTAFVSIMEGCNKYCSYCIVPYTRGVELSRPFDDVVAEVYHLSEQGVREVTLLGQNVNDYRGLMHTGEIADLALLIRYIAEIDNIKRIRYTTSHPLAFSDNLIQAYADIPKLVDHLHLPVQSGSDRILAMMKRGYTAKLYLQKIQKLKSIRPNISISSDFIVGFPTESDEDFAATIALMKEVEFDTSFSFIYSQRPGTPAAKLMDNISIAVKKERLKHLQELNIAQAAKISHAMLGTKQKVLVDNISRKNIQEMSGRTENNRVVNFPGASDLLGKLVTLQITEALPNSLRGILIND